MFQDHNCVRELRTLVNTQQQKMGEMQTEILEAKLQLNEQKREIQMLKVFGTRKSQLQPFAHC